MGRSIYLDQRQLLCAQCDCRQIVDGTVWHNGSGEQSDRPEGGVDLQASRLWLQRLAQGWRIHSGQKVRQIKYRMTFAKKLHSLGNLIWRSIQNVWLHFYYFCICFLFTTAKRNCNSFMANGLNSSKSPTTIRTRNMWKRMRTSSSATTKARARMNRRCIRRAKFYRSWIV